MEQDLKEMESSLIDVLDIVLSEVKTSDDWFNLYSQIVGRFAKKAKEVNGNCITMIAVDDDDDDNSLRAMVGYAGSEDALVSLMSGGIASTKLNGIYDKAKSRLTKKKIKTNKKNKRK